ncbi:MAG: bestrophin family protein [Myxococcales bacterium]|nr:bestrophin family protein [Myxococcales bacterium]
MFVDYHRSVTTLAAWQWRSLVGYAAAASFIVLIEKVLATDAVDLSPVPLTVIGAAIGIFVSFRTNSCYDRWWEARKLWGQLVNTSRLFAMQVLSYPAGPRDELRPIQQRIVRRHIAYVHALRSSLREQDPTRDAEVIRYLEVDELARDADEPNLNAALLHHQLRELARLARARHLDARALQLLDRSIATLLDVQGGCERIKKTPFPQTYEFVATLLIAAYAVLLPLGIVENTGWFAIPITVLVCFAFRVIDQVGTMLEDPFSMAPAALPLNAIATNIEIEACKRLGEPEPPEPPTPDDDGVLM